ncbi:hypothetical protein BGLA2_810047 [Burkholderia gladioli]|nr:hypothetical protein BGLA2_810047 [Burkholderia gladioli]
MQLCLGPSGLRPWARPERIRRRLRSVETDRQTCPICLNRKQITWINDTAVARSAY